MADLVYYNRNSKKTVVFVKILVLEWKMFATACDIGITSNTVRKPQERNC